MEDTNIEYYARSENSKGEKETVSFHLQRVSKLAAIYAKIFFCEQEAKIAGMYHDFGKYSDDFQGVLKKEVKGINHAIPGAIAQLLKFGDKGLLIAGIIMGHHYGLTIGDKREIKNLLGKYYKGEESYDKEGKKVSLLGKEAYNKARSVFEAENPQLEELNSSPNFYSSNDPNLVQMLYMRMLFSCLVDADYTSAAEHFDKDIYEKSDNKNIDFNTILESLLNYKKEVSQKSTSAKSINLIREELFKNCVDEAKNLRGLFTLTAPTGTGKTLALFAFALRHAIENNLSRIIIVLPYLSIIEQNAKIYKEIAGEHNVLEDHSQTKYSEDLKLLSQKWSMPIIITTSVKFFESLFANQPTECRKLHNIANSVIVFDEAQSLPVELAKVTTDAINELCERYQSSVVFSTATQPNFKFIKGSKWQPKEIVKDVNRLFNSTKRVNVIWNNKERVKFENIAKEMAKRSSSCAIVNLKKHAKMLWELLYNYVEDRDGLFHISTSMCPQHRLDVINEIKERQKQDKSCQLVSTQCIEAGVDLDFKIMFRSLAPLDSIIQAAGRCNRNGIDNQMGQVIVFEPNIEGSLYPKSQYYEKAANKVKIMLSRKEIDIFSPEDIKEYYQMFFSDCGNLKQKLADAIEKLDFEDTAKYYKLINTNTINIIVPYKNNIELYNNIKEEALKNGISNELFIKASPITVSIFTEIDKKYKDVCEPLYYFRRGQQDKHPSNWHLLLEETAYDDKLGFNLSGVEQNTII